MSGPSIRAAVADDADRIRAIAKAAYAPYVARIGRRPAPMDADFDAHIAAREVWLATEGGATLGYAVLVDGDDALRLDNIATAPEARRVGAGRALLVFAEAVARRRGFVAIDLYTNAKMVENLALYPRIGYRETDRRREDEFDRVFFRKELSEA